MEIRKATIEDLKAIQELNLQLFQKEIAEYDDTLDDKWTFSEIGTQYYHDKIQNNDSIALVAVDNAKTVGYMVGGIRKAKSSRNIDSIAELENMFILDEYRCQGIGSKLVEEFLNWSKKQGVSRVRVIASAQNHRAIDFYKKHGFQEYDIILEGEL